MLFPSRLKRIEYILSLCVNVENPSFEAFTVVSWYVLLNWEWFAHQVNTHLTFIMSCTGCDEYIQNTIGFFFISVASACGWRFDIHHKTHTVRFIWIIKPNQFAMCHDRSKCLIMNGIVHGCVLHICCHSSAIAVVQMNIYMQIIQWIHSVHQINAF